METIQTKCCTKCGIEKTLSSEFFHKDKNSFKNICKSCQNKRDREKYEINKKTFTSNVSCGICNKKFYKKPSDIQEINFCSKPCLYEHRKQIKYPERKTGELKNCGCCNKEIYVIKCQLKEQNFCSKDCMYEYAKGKENPKLKNGEHVNCNECNKLVYRPKSLINDKIFCSKTCFDNSRKKRQFIKCDECQNDIEIKPSRKICDNNFCCKQCESNFKIKQQGKNDELDSNGIKIRQCILCNEKYPLNTKFFSKHDGCKEGFRTECKPCRNKIQKERYENDNLYKMTVKMRGLVYATFSSKGFEKIKRTEEILNCSINDFMIYISNLFTDGMSFENHGKWHLDHKIPVSSAKTMED